MFITIYPFCIADETGLSGLSFAIRAVFPPLIWGVFAGLVMFVIRDKEIKIEKRKIK